MKEYRCKFCHRLLAKLQDDDIGIAVEKLNSSDYFIVGTSVEIKCSKCNKINEFSLGVGLANKEDWKFVAGSIK